MLPTKCHRLYQEDKVIRVVGSVYFYHYFLCALGTIAHREKIYKIIQIRQKKC